MILIRFQRVIVSTLPEAIVRERLLTVYDKNPTGILPMLDYGLIKGDYKTFRGIEKDNMILLDGLFPSRVRQFSYQLKITLLPENGGTKIVIKSFPHVWVAVIGTIFFAPYFFGRLVPGFWFDDWLDKNELFKEFGIAFLGITILYLLLFIINNFFFRLLLGHIQKALT